MVEMGSSMEMNNVATVDRINGQLMALALINEGPDTVCTFELVVLPHRESLRESLAGVFTAGVRHRDNKAYTEKDWQVRTRLLGMDIGDLLSNQIATWLFHMPYSPTFEARRHYVMANIVASVCNDLKEVVGECEIHEVFVQPPVWYEASWQDFALVGKGATHFLHFGVTD